MGDIVELDTPLQNMTSEQALSVALREDFERVLVIGHTNDQGISILASDMSPQVAYWLAAKVKATLLEQS